MSSCDFPTAVAADANSTNFKRGFVLPQMPQFSRRKQNPNKTQQINLGRRKLHSFATSPPRSTRSPWGEHRAWEPGGKFPNYHPQTEFKRMKEGNTNCHRGSELSRAGSFIGIQSEKEIFYDISHAAAIP